MSATWVHAKRVLLAVSAGLLGLGAACETQLETVPEGALAMVGQSVIYPEELEARRGQLDAYGQRRFGQEGGRMALLEAAITQRLLTVEARRLGLDGDPRVDLAELEELARLQLAVELERRVPERSVAEDTAALRAYYDAHPEEFALPEKREAELVEVGTAEEGEKLMAELAAGTITWEQVSDGSKVPAQVRDDERFPLFHRYLFDPELKQGDYLPTVVYALRTYHVARVGEIVPSTQEPFDDPRVQARLVLAVREPLIEAARKQLLDELAERYPVTER